MTKKTVLVTGAAGFIGTNLVLALERRSDVAVVAVDVATSAAGLAEAAGRAEIVYHLAGVNRPTSLEEFETGNVGYTEELLGLLEAAGRRPAVVLSSSIQACLDNAYGASKRKAESLVRGFGERSGAPVYVFRLPGVFGRWARPNYNSVVATFCHNLSRDFPIQISDPERVVELAYVQDVVAVWLRLLDGVEPPSDHSICRVEPTYRVTLAELAEMLREFRESRKTLRIGNFADDFQKKLYATYVSYLPQDQFAYNPEQRRDDRGTLAEVVKSATFGQLFISRTRPGITRGNHYHDTKVEKFCVVEGEALVRFRSLLGREVFEYRASGGHFTIIDIPPGYTHSIQNIGESDLVVLFWANEIFDPGRPDTFAAPVLNGR